LPDSPAGARRSMACARGWPTSTRGVLTRCITSQLRPWRWILTIPRARSTSRSPAGQ
jgi:hypothetical protein